MARNNKRCPVKITGAVPAKALAVESFVNMALSHFSLTRSAGCCRSSTLSEKRQIGIRQVSPPQSAGAKFLSLLFHATPKASIKRVLRALIDRGVRVETRSRVALCGPIGERARESWKTRS